MRSSKNIAADRKTENKSVYFIGIGGSGMMPLARMAALSGWRVAGSDQGISETKKHDLEKDGIRVFRKPGAELIEEYSMVVYSTAIAQDHPERRKACKLASMGKTRLLHRMDFLSLLMSRNTKEIAISATHGKTSTASLAGWSLIQIGLEPDILVGGHPLYLKSGIQCGNGEVGVYETDESDGSFLKTQARFRLLLNIDKDHLDHYGSFEKLKAAFLQFLSQTPEDGLAVVNADDPQIRGFLQDSAFLDSMKERLFLYSTQELPSGLQARSVQARFVAKQDRLRITQVLGEPLLPCREFCVSLPGRHFASNALGLFLLLHLAFPQIPQEKILDSFESFPGVERRMQLLSQKRDILIYDDYAHHPTEIEAVLSALRLRLPQGGRLYALFEPHRYTRIEAQYHRFAEMLMLADRICLLPLFAAGEPPIEGVGSELVARAIRDLGSCDVRQIHPPELSSLLRELKPGDILVGLGAGRVSEYLRSALLDSSY